MTASSPTPYAVTTGPDGNFTSYIPLTTTFTPPASCTSLFWDSGPSLQAFAPGYGLSIDLNAQCVPPAMTTFWEQGLLFPGGARQHTVISAGPVVCPKGWTTADRSTSDSTSVQINCCPSGYQYFSDVYGNCLSSVSAGEVLTYASASNSPAPSPEHWTTVSTTLDSDTTVGAVAVVGWNIKGATSSTPSSTTTSPPSTTASATGDTSTNPSLPSPTQTTSDSGLSSGAKAGIGVGVAFGVLGILALLATVFLLRRRRRGGNEGAAALAAQEKDQQTDTRYNKYELPDSQTQRAELSDGQVGGGRQNLKGYYGPQAEEPSELPANERPMEMDSVSGRG
ncbi:MAG: hypothetical protein M1821_008426 [Bathelium mastoideum]|nr:MAG: hypothetical protein M1821_008426 [Bathelium mastoideum]